MASLTLLLLHLLLMASAASAWYSRDHYYRYYGGSVTFTPKVMNSNGTHEVELRNKQATYFCHHNGYRCYYGNCGTQTQSTVAQIARNSYGLNWCQYEVVTKLKLQSNLPFAIRYPSYFSSYYGHGYWIGNIRGSWTTWKMMAHVDLGTRSDTGESNRSPVTTTLPILRIPRNCPRTFKMIAFDPDGDHVRCRVPTSSNTYECSLCGLFSSFSLNQNSCSLTYKGYSGSGYIPVELVVEDFPNKHITLSYSDGSYTSKGPLSAGRRKRQVIISASTTAATATPAPTTTATPTITTSTPAPTITAARRTNTASPTATATTATPAPTITAARRTNTAAPTATATTATPAPTITAARRTNTAAPTATATTTTPAPTITAARRTNTAAPTTTATTTTPALATTAAIAAPAPTTTATTTTAALTITAAPTTTSTIITPAPTTTGAPVTTTATTTTTAPTTTPPPVTTAASTTTRATTASPAPTTTTTTTTTPVPKTTPAPTTTAAPRTTTPLYRSSIAPLSKLPLQFSVLVDNFNAHSCLDGYYFPIFLSPTPSNGVNLPAFVNHTLEIRVRSKAQYTTIHDLIISGPKGISRLRISTEEYIIKWLPTENEVNDHFPICFVSEARDRYNRVYQSELRCVIADVGHHKSTVTCNEKTITVEVEKSYLIRRNVDTLHLNDFTDPSCNLKTLSNTTHLVAIMPLNTCGTLVEEDDDNIIFKNEITSANPNEIITRQHDVEIVISCVYPKRTNLTLGFSHKNPYAFTEKGFGVFTFQFEFFEGQLFRKQIDSTTYPVEVNLKQMMFMQIKASTSIPNTELFVETCRATPYDNPNSRISYTIIENGCVKDKTVQVYPTSKSQFRFGMEAFEFIGAHEEVYITCTVMLCESGIPGTRCSQGCVRSMSGNNRGKREAVAQTSIHSISQGPLRLAKTSDSQASGLSMNLGMNLVFIVGCLLVCGVVIYRSRRPRAKYQPLPTSDTD